ncbi:FtsX-like permease family protein [Leptolyngbya sp. 15MV]|nr:FtsX-like permease family protein [Leptolyngbya sp. 15MV]
MNALDALYLPLAIATAPLWARKQRRDWPERLGRIDPVPSAQPPRPRLLLHAVSVGETNAIRELVPLLAPHVHPIVSVGTDTGIARARELFDPPAGSGRPRLADVVRYPLDFSWSVARFLDATRPDAVALVELELWPNFVRACEQRGIPIAIINGRLSERSFKGYRRLRWFFRPSFGRLTFAAVQDETYAKRFREMGLPADRCLVTGSMKWDTARIEDDAPGSAALARELGIERGPRPELAARIQAEPGLRARTRDEFANDGVQFIIENTGIPLNFGITVALGFIVGVAIVGLTFSLFIRDNIKQFGALKAIGVTNRKIRSMVAAQAGLVGLIGYGLGVLGTVAFIWGFSGDPTFKGFYIPWQIPLISLVAVALILALTGWLALRNVLRTDPASVFR